jgi:hypothetical protein
MGLENLPDFWFESSEVIFEKRKKLVWTKKFSAYFSIFTIAIRK